MAKSKLKVKMGLKQILGGILTFILVFTSIPITGLTTFAATGSLQKQINKAKNGDTIVISGTHKIKERLVIEDKTITLKGDGTLRYNSLSIFGILEIGPHANVTMEGITIDGNNTKADNRAIAVNIRPGGSFTMNSGTIKNNKVKQHGGGVHNSGTFIMNGGVITGNTTEGDGGGVYNANTRSTFIMNNGTIEYNYSSFKGGGVSAGAGGTVIINGGKIYGNSAGEAGGGLFTEGITFKMTGGEISGNSASKSGGGVYNRLATFDMSGGTIRGNIAKAHGGGVYNTQIFKMSGGTIRGNIAKGLGGGVDNNAGTFEMTDGTITGNSASEYGGGVYNNDGRHGIFTMTSGTISNNRGTKGGNEVYSAGNFEVQGTSTIVSNVNNDSVSFSSADEHIIVTGKFSGSIRVKQDPDKVAVVAKKGYTITQDDAAHFMAIDGDDLEFINNTLVYKQGIQNAIDNASSSGDSVLIDGTLIINKPLKLNRNVTLKGNGTLLRAKSFIRGTMVNIMPNANVTMEGITIDGNNIENTDSAVYINKDASFTMNSGTIKNNTATHGGGVRNKGTFNMTGGKISENTAVDGGGVYNEGTFTMNGGAISGNTGSGVYHNGTFKVQGTATIDGNNKIDGNDKNDNVRVESSKSPVIVSGEFNGKIKVNSKFGNVVVKPADEYTMTKSDIGCFEADGENAHLEYINNKLIYTENKTEWGQMVNRERATYYIDENGRASAEITYNGKVWLNTKSDGSGSWYCLDNTKGTFKIGSRFYVQVIDDISKYYDKIGSEYREKIEDGKLKIFLIGVIDPDGNEYTNLDTEINCYVKVDPNWDKDKLNAIFINGEKTEKIDIEYMGTIESPSSGDKFAKLTLKHFSPYAIYQSKDLQENTTESTLENAPATGENSNYAYVFGFSTMLIIAAAGMIVTKRKFEK